MIISFYSYKGGVGRSQLCANIAAYLCHEKGKRVLLWDWDFEAPGLHYFFNKTNAEINKKGTLEIVEEYTALMRGGKTVVESDLKYICPAESIIPLFSKEKGGCIDLLAAGNYNNEFTWRSNNFNWFEFYNLLDGAVYIEKLKEHLKTLKYEYVLIDSRTGINDYSGICNIQLPDMNVIVVAPTMQNFEGSKAIVDKILCAEYNKIKNKTPMILPVLSRVDNSNKDRFIWIRYFTEYFSYLIKNLDTELEPEFLPEIFRDIYYKDTLLPYVPAISVGENVFFPNEHDITNTDYIQQFKNIADMLETLKIHRTINFYKRVDEETWIRYAAVAKEKEDLKKAALAYGHIAVKVDEDERSVYNKKVEELFEQSKLGRPRSKSSNRLIMFNVLGILLSIVAFLTIWTSNTKDKTLSNQNEDKGLKDSLNEVRATNDFIRRYYEVGKQSTLTGNLGLLQQYYGLSKANQDSLKDIKNRLLDELAYSFEGFVDTFYYQLRTNKIQLDRHFDVQVYFGAFRLISRDDLQKRLINFRKNNQVTNGYRDFNIDANSTWITVTYRESGNVLLDKFSSYKSVNLENKVMFDYNGRIRFYAYNIIDTVRNDVGLHYEPNVTVEMFYNQRVSRNKAGKVVSVLKKKLSLDVSQRTAFSSSTNPESSFYILVNQIRYNGDKEYKVAQQMQRYLKASTGISFSLVPTRTTTPGYVSLFLVEND